MSDGIIPTVTPRRGGGYLFRMTTSLRPNVHNLCQAQFRAGYPALEFGTPQGQRTYSYEGGDFWTEWYCAGHADKAKVKP